MNGRNDNDEERRNQGFIPVSDLLQDFLRTAAEKRGFATAHLIVDWADIVGERIARMAEPDKMTHRAHDFTAVLSVLTTSAYAPLLQMEIPRIIERVNASYGYRAVGDIRIVQTSRRRLHHLHRKENRTASAPKVTTEISKEARALTKDIKSPRLRAAAEQFAGQLLARQAVSNSKGSK